MAKFWVTECGTVSIDYVIDAKDEAAALKFVQGADQHQLRRYEENRNEDEFQVLDNVREVEEGELDR